jgi:hypothetical protein
MKKYKINMKTNRLATAIILLTGFVSFAQVEVKTESKDFKLGDGIQLSLNDGEFKLKISGFIQGVLKNEKQEGQDAQSFMNTRYTFLTLSGSAYKDKLTYMIQNNFSSGRPLLDAWVAYSPISHLKVSFGQKQTFTNNREMTFFEDKLQFVERGIFSSEFSNSGREFGVFIESEYSLKNFILRPKFAITSGDGLNSFGASSIDVDKGGLKYGGRLDILPLGNFKPGNDGYIADLLHEDKVKILAGTAFSYNYGASNKFGEGHDDFKLYGSDLKVKYPDYRKIYSDILLKYKGFSFLGEYINTSALSLTDMFVNPTATTSLFPTEISTFLALGSGINIQTGYVTESGYAVDLKLEKLTSEFTNSRTVLANQDAFTLGVTKYIRGNNLKIQASLTQRNREQFNFVANNFENIKTVTAQFCFQVVF